VKNLSKKIRNQTIAMQRAQRREFNRRGTEKEINDGQNGENGNGRNLYRRKRRYDEQFLHEVAKTTGTGRRRGAGLKKFI